MGKPNKKFTQYARLDPESLYSAIAVDSTKSLLVQAHQTKTLPNKPEVNVVEMDVRQHARELFEQQAMLLEAEKGEPRRTVKETQVDPKEASNRTEHHASELKQINQENLEDCRLAKTQLDEKQHNLDAYKKAHHITRSVQIGSKTKATLLTAFFFCVDSAFNGLQLFSSNLLQGGVLGAVAVSGLVSAINTFSGFICGEHVWRRLSPLNSSVGQRMFAWVALSLITVFVLGTNGLFAYVRAFEGSNFSWLAADSTTYLNFFGVFFVGFIIFTWVTIKWNKTNDPLIEYGNLHKQVCKQQSAIEGVRQQSLERIAIWKDGACDDLDTLLDEERTDFTVADEALDECLLLNREIEVTALNIKTLHEAVLVRHRTAVASSGFSEIPDYFSEEPEVTNLYNPIDMNTLSQHVETLRTHLCELEDSIQSCKQTVFVEAETASEVLCKQCCWSES